MASKGFRVVIVGGSIAGLTLALALEKNNIDFVVLEAYPEIAPQVGASIAVLPNGFRILDQIGCFEDILSKVNCTIDNFIVRDSDGKALIHVKDLDHHLVSRHGYPMIFFERRMVIEVLYQHIRQKDKDGEAFKGDILIGADGIHSTVGQQIWQAASEKNPELKKVQYRCLFGISSKVPGIGEDTLHHVTNVGSSSFAASGPNERTYWCLFFNTGTIHHGDDVPPYTDKDEAETVRQHGNDAITESVKFSDLYDRKIMSVCTPLHEGVLGTWHSQRCMVVGDAVHKFNPIVGLGGMSAMETCSALTNNLVTLLASNPAASDISVSAIASVFSATQSSRAPRAAALVAASRDTQHRFAMETALLKIINRYVYPTMGTDGTLRLLSEAYPGAVSVESLPLPEEKVRARNFPYEDELGWGR
ncbi:fad binding domain-containing protein [Neofusicoccum parvum]|uniref:Fad binding domain-containing protein n=1 Tax=Neofusicoccum parvum TaxID=310453 RepID=A0ACB5SAC8_9PEZI|nr:fad binding domain-containing protein [Neofusicoccum parvum]